MTNEEMKSLSTKSFVQLAEDARNEIVQEGTMKDKAKIIRGILKKEFTGIKFSVKSDYSSVHIRWTDGPSDAFVNSFVKEFEKIDRDSASGEILSGGNDFVFVNRDVSDKKYAELTDLLDKKLESHSDELRPNEKQTLFYNILRSTDLNKKLEVNDSNSSGITTMFIGNLHKDPLFKKLKNKGLIY
jgi:hypothetical protein